MATPPTNASTAASAPGTHEITPAIEDTIIAGAVGTETTRAQAAEAVEAGKQTTDEATASTTGSAVATNTAGLATLQTRVTGDETMLPGSIRAGVQILVTTNSSATGTIALSFAAGGLPDAAYHLTLTGSTTLTLGGATAGYLQRLTVLVQQDATGSRALTLPSGVKWQGGTAPALSTTAGSLQEFNLKTMDGSTTVTGY